MPGRGGWHLTGCAACGRGNRADTAGTRNVSAKNIWRSTHRELLQRRLVAVQSHLQGRACLAWIHRSNRRFRSGTCRYGGHPRRMLRLPLASFHLAARRLAVVRSKLRTSGRFGVGLERSWHGKGDATSRCRAKLMVCGKGDATDRDMQVDRIRLQSQPDGTKRSDATRRCSSIKIRGVDQQIVSSTTRRELPGTTLRDRTQTSA